MRRLRALIALITLIALGGAAYGQTFPEPRTLKINDRVSVLLGPTQHANRVNQGYMINSTVIVGDKAEFRKLETGITGSTDIEVLSGLKVGDEIVTGSYQVIRSTKNGATVKIDNKPPVVKPTT